MVGNSAKALMRSIMAIAICGLPHTAHAVPFTITSQLTGDIRDGNPGDLIVDVTITGDTTSNMVSWTVDLNSPAHPGIKLMEFNFNMVGVAADYSFSNVMPAGWAVEDPGSATGAGAGGNTFTFDVTDQPGMPNNDVTDAIDLTFDMTKLGSNFTVNDFLNAPVFSGDAGMGQLGAHLQSLSVNEDTCPQEGCSDSGFALGDYDVTVDIPEPGTLALFGLGLAGLGIARRRKSI